MRKKKHVIKKPIVKAHYHPVKLLGTFTIDNSNPLLTDPEHFFQQYPFAYDYFVESKKLLFVRTLYTSGVLVTTSISQ